MKEEMTREEKEETVIYMLSILPIDKIMELEARFLKRGEYDIARVLKEILMIRDRGSI